VRKLIESTLVSLDGVIEAPDRWAPFDDESTALAMEHLWYMPVVVGAGQRLFEDVDASSLALRLTDERRLGNGSVILSYAVG
jgi:hypothetical protein